MRRWRLSREHPGGALARLGLSLDIAAEGPVALNGPIDAEKSSLPRLGLDPAACQEPGARCSR
jgi:hypothetical protein